MAGKRRKAAVTAPVCPHCGAGVEAGPATTVVRPRTAEMEALFRGGLNRRECPACGKAFSLDTPVLFRDDSGPFLIYFLPLSDRERRLEAAGEMASITARAFPESGDAPPACRIAFTRRQFLEKIAIRMQGLDDRVVEYVKYQMFRNPKQKIDAIRNELFFDFSPDHPDQLGFLVFDRESGAAVGTARLPMAVYRELAEALSGPGGLSEELDRLFPGVHVSVEELL